MDQAVARAPKGAIGVKVMTSAGEVLAERNFPKHHPRCRCSICQS